MPVLPKPYPDEVVGSFIVRACRHTGLPFKRLLRTIYGSQRSTASFLLGENLRPLAYRAGLELEELLFQHTMFPYAVAFMAPATQAQLAAKALAARPREDSLASLTKNISHGVAFRRVCKQCIQADLAKYGESYWHRQHLLPGVVVCSLHGRPLFETGVALRGSSQAAVTLLPHEAAGELKAPERLPARLASSVAAISVAALQGVHQQSDNWLDTYRAGAMALGYLLPSGDVAGAVVALVLRRLFGLKFLASAGCPVADGLRNTWPALMVRPGGTSNFATAKHVLLKAFFEASVAPPTDMSSVYKAPGKKTRDYKRLDTRTLAKLRTSVGRAASAGERVTMQELLRSAGAWSAFKHHRELLPKTNAFLQEFKSTDQSERQIGGRPYWRKRVPSRYGKPDVDDSSAMPD